MQHAYRKPVSEDYQTIGQSNTKASTVQVQRSNKGTKRW